MTTEICNLFNQVDITEEPLLEMKRERIFNELFKQSISIKQSIEIFLKQRGILGKYNSLTLRCNCEDVIPYVCIFGYGFVINITTNVIQVINDYGNYMYSELKLHLQQQLDMLHKTMNSYSGIQ
jgi:hypothetical protein